MGKLHHCVTLGGLCFLLRLVPKCFYLTDEESKEEDAEQPGESHVHILQLVARFGIFANGSGRLEGKVEAAHVSAEQGTSWFLSLFVLGCQT